MKPARAFFASLSVSLLVLTLSYQATAIPAALTQPMPQPEERRLDGPCSAVKKVKKGEDKDDMSELAPLLSVS